MKNIGSFKTFQVIVFGLLLAAGVSLAGCGGGGSAGSQDATGLYLNGTGTLDGTGSLNDITAFVSNNEIIVYSATAHVLLKGAITSVSGSAYTATVDVYTNGSIEEQGVTVSGTVTNGSQITGALQGSGAGAGDFAVTFSDAFNNSSSFDKLAVSNSVGERWEGTGYSTEDKSMYFTNISGTDGTYTGGQGGLNPNFCAIDNTGQASIPDSSKNIYRMQNDYSDNGNNCQLPGTGFTGFAALIETTTPQTLLVALANGTYSIFGTLDKIEP